MNTSPVVLIYLIYLFIFFLYLCITCKVNRIDQLWCVISNPIICHRLYLLYSYVINFHLSTISTRLWFFYKSLKICSDAGAYINGQVSFKRAKELGTLLKTSQVPQTTDDKKTSRLGTLDKTYYLNNALSARLPSGRLTFPKWLRVLLQFKFGSNLATCLSVIEWQCFRTLPRA